MMPPVKQEDITYSSPELPSSGGITQALGAEDKDSPLPLPSKAKTVPGSKTNILSILQNHGSKNESFKTIGNRIVIPMKVAVPTKSFKKDSTGSNIITAFPANNKTTFQMAVPIKKFAAGSGPQTVILRDEKRLICKNYGKMQVKSPIFVPKAALKARSASIDAQAAKSPKNKENNWRDNVEYGDLNKFMTSVDLRMGQNGDDKDSVVSSSDSAKFNSSLTSLKLEDVEREKDNDLTCLSWLSGNNKELLDTIRMCNPDDPGIGLSEDEVEGGEERINKPIFTALSRIQEAGGCHNGQYLSEMEYDPMSKPPYSFSCLIFMAVEDSYLKRLPVKEIYFWVCKHFPYFRTAAPGWKNSIRHNLSLNRCFKKYESKQNQETVKGSLWCIDPAYRPNLVQALKRSPFYPYLHPTGVGQPLSLNNLANLLPGVHTGRVPSWSPSMPPKQPKPSSTLWADADMASAALNLMGLKGNDSTSPKGAENIQNTLAELRTKICNDVDWFDELGTSPKNSVEEVVITGSSEDHVYSLIHKPSRKTPSSIKQEEPPRCLTPDSEKSAPDAAYEFETAGMSESDEDVLIVAEDGDVVMADYDSDASDGGHLFDSGFGGMSFNGREDRKRKISAASSRRKSSKPTPSRRRKMDEDATMSSAKKDSRRRSSSSKRKSTPLKVRVRKATPKKRQRKLSDVDSGKDSPKAPRIKSRRKTNPKKLDSPKKNGGHNTRASGHKLLGASSEERGRKKRKAVIREGDDEDVKLAAGSLLRLAGLLSSPAR